MFCYWWCFVCAISRWLLWLFVAVMRSLSVLQEVFVPHVASIITQLTNKLMLVSKVSLVSSFTVRVLIQGGPKKMAPFFVHFIISSNINRYSKFFHCQNQETICNKTITMDPTTSQVRRYTTLWNIRRRTQVAMPLTSCVVNVDRAFHVAPKQPGLKSSQLHGLGCSSTDGLSILTIHDSQPAEASDCHWVGQTATAFGSCHWSVASHSCMHSPAARRTHWTLT